MISLKSFVDAVHDAVVVANDTLTDSSVGLLAKFFKKEKKSNNPNAPEKLIPETVVVKYPHITDKGVEEVDVNVPLLTLAPITCPTVDEVDFSAKFELEVVDNELKLLFSKDNKDTSDASSNRSGSIKIVISPQDMPEGFKNIVEGYERILKAQIP